MSNISRISKLNNSIQFKLDSFCNTSEWRSCRDITSNFLVDSHKKEFKKLPEFTKVGKAISIGEESYSDYAKLKLIIDCIEEVINDKNITDASILKKLRDFITVYNVKKCLYLPSHSKDIKEDLTLLGIIDLPQYEFSYEEQLSIKSCLEAKLREKIHSFLTM